MTLHYLDLKDGTVTATPAAFPQAVCLARDQHLHGLTIRDDYNGTLSCDLNELASLPWLERFGVSPGIKPARLLHLEALRSLQNLKTLALHDYKNLDLAYFPNLEELFVRDRAGLHGLETLTRLRRLQIWGLRQGDFSKRNLESLQELTVIQAAQTVVRVVGLECLTGLRHLTLSHSRALAAVGSLPPNLLKFRVEACAHLVDFSCLANNPSLDFVFGQTIQSLAFVPSMRRLTSLAFDSVSDSDLSPILQSKTLRTIRFENRKRYTHTQEELQRALDIGATGDSSHRDEPATAEVMSQRDGILSRWRSALAQGDSQFTQEGIDAVECELSAFEGRAMEARGQQQALRAVLRRTVLALEHLGGAQGTFGCFLETDEREELVPYLLGIVSDCGLVSDQEDPTEPYRNW
jgi:hypothetical protein